MGMSNNSVLVLNVDYTPIGVIGGERAITLVVCGAADTIKDTGDEIHSQNLSIPEPSVIRLNRYVHVPYGAPVPLSRRALFARDSHLCAFCGEEGADTIDHVIPKAQGGKHVWTNVVSACVACNSKKRDRTPEEAEMPLLFKPYTPSRSGMIKARRRPEWDEFLLS